MIEPTGHPEPDLLAAFSGDSLSDGERSRVIKHLAICQGCRECVFAACEGTRNPTGVQRHRSLAFSLLGLAAGAACVMLPIVHIDSFTNRTDPVEVRTISSRVEPNPRDFLHVSLLRDPGTGSERTLLSHLMLRKQRNQIVVKSRYGERWFTFTSAGPSQNLYRSAGTPN